MKIPVVGFDPSMQNWGIAESQLDLITGILDTPKLSLVTTKADDSKQVRVNSSDLARANELASVVIQVAKQAKVVFVEIPVGSQSARAMTSYGICIGILGSIRSMGIPLIEVNPTEVKKAFTGNKNATKREMIDQAFEYYPEANFPVHKGKIVDKAEHMADAIASIHAGVLTTTFQQLMRIFAEVK